MASLTGHHWTIYGLADIGVVLILGFIFMQRVFSFDATRLVALVAGAPSLLVVAAWPSGWCSSDRPTACDNNASGAKRGIPVRPAARDLLLNF